MQRLVRLVSFTSLLLACGSPAPSPDTDGGIRNDANVDAARDGDASVEGCAPGANEDCYTGPSGTEDVGACQGGSRACGDDGTWGACTGEVLPAIETCENGRDDDCNGTVDESLDVDGDGWTTCDGDCCDTDADCESPELVNPAALEVSYSTPPSGYVPEDDDCDGEVDETVVPCDTGLTLTSADPTDAAHAIGVCESASDRVPGVVSARYVRANGSPFLPGNQVGLSMAFGTNVRPIEGDAMFVLSTGRARDASQPEACGSPACTSNVIGVPPAGFPQEVPGCDVASTIADDVALELQLRVPSNATGFAFDHRFFTFEYPAYVCTRYNDQFVVVVTEAPPGSINGNVAFDSMTNPVGVNIAYLDVCPGCAAGAADLAGTGFDTWGEAGGTSWMTTRVPATGGATITIRFTLWDAGDPTVDSTAIVDHFRWITDDDVVVGTARATL